MGKCLPPTITSLPVEQRFLVGRINTDLSETNRKCRRSTVVRRKERSRFSSLFSLLFTRRTYMRTYEKSQLFDVQVFCRYGGVTSLQR